MCHRTFPFPSPDQEPDTETPGETSAWQVSRFIIATTFCCLATGRVDRDQGGDSAVQWRRPKNLRDNSGVSKLWGDESVETFYLPPPGGGHQPLRCRCIIAKLAPGSSTLHHYQRSSIHNRDSRKCARTAENLPEGRRNPANLEVHNVAKRVPPAPGSTPGVMNSGMTLGATTTSQKKRGGRGAPHLTLSLSLTLTQFSRNSRTTLRVVKK